MIYLINIVKSQIFENNRLLEPQIIRIIIKVSSTGEQEIICSNFNTLPDSVSIKDNIVEILDNNKVNVLDINYKIILNWNSIITNCDNMFKGLSNIIQIDFSNFITSK